MIAETKALYVNFLKSLKVSLKNKFNVGPSKESIFLTTIYVKVGSASWLRDLVVLQSVEHSSNKCFCGAPWSSGLIRQ